MRLSHRDFDGLQHAILELNSLRTRDEFNQSAPRILLRLVPADYVALVTGNATPASGELMVDRYVESDSRIDAGVVHQVKVTAPTHPFSQYLAATGHNTALKISDFFNLRQFLDSSLYNEFYVLLEAGRLMAVAVSLLPGSVTTANFARHRARRDFTERDRVMLNLVRPHLDLARRNVEWADNKKSRGARPLSEFDLTAKEKEVASWMAQGKTNAEIAVIIDAKPRTVEKHMESILAKLKVENRVAAAIIIALGNPDPA